MNVPGRCAGGAEEGAERGLPAEVVQQLVQAVPLVGRDLVPKVMYKWFEFVGSPALQSKYVNIKYRIVQVNSIQSL